MAEDGQLARIASRPVSAEPSLADLLDPIALEERLRGGARPPRRGPRAPPRRAIPPPAAAPPARGPAARRPSSARRPHRPHRGAAPWPIGLIFLAGLGLGGAAVAVLALRALPARIAVAPDPHAPPSRRRARRRPSRRPRHHAAPPSSPPPRPGRHRPRSPPRRPRPPPPAPRPSTPPPAEAARPARPRRPRRARLGGRTARQRRAPSSRARGRPRRRRPPRRPPRPGPAGAGLHPLPALGLRRPPPTARDALLAAGVARGRDRAGPLRHRPQQHPLLPRRRPRARRRARPARRRRPRRRGAGGARLHRLRHPRGPGKVEIWLAGNPRRRRRRARAAAPRRRAPPPRATPAPAHAAFQMPGVIAPPPTQAEQVERILIERLRQRPLTAAPPA